MLLFVCVCWFFCLFVFVVVHIVHKTFHKAGAVLSPADA